MFHTDHGSPGHRKINTDPSIAIRSQYLNFQYILCANGRVMGGDP